MDAALQVIGNAESSFQQGRHVWKTEPPPQQEIESQVVVVAAALCSAGAAFAKNIFRSCSNRPNRAGALGALLTVATLLLAAVDAPAQTIESSRNNEPVLRKLFISPASTSLAGGKARLVLTGLTRKGAGYVGDYHLKVVPYFFKSEKGTLSMIVSEQSLLNLNQNVPVEFGGKATTSGTGKTRPITARAAQTAPLRGTVKISIATENGVLVFNTFYRFGEQ